MLGTAVGISLGDFTGAFIGAPLGAFLGGLAGKKTYFFLTFKICKKDSLTFIAEDEKAKGEMIEKSGQRGVPVILIEGREEPLVGFDQDALEEALNL